MRLIALLSWFDEPTDALLRCLDGLASAGVDHVVAVDGGYRVFPGAARASETAQAAAIYTACRSLGLGLTVHTPPAVWGGNEVEKRTRLFALGYAVSTPADWFFVVDADEVVAFVPDDMRARLAATECDVADVEICDTVALRANQKDWPGYFQMRRLFRAQPIRVVTNHITYVTADGTVLAGRNGMATYAPSLDLCSEPGQVRIDHVPDRRPQPRQIAKAAYYARRDADRIERGDCERCGVQAVRLVPKNWRMADIGPVAEWAESCGGCVASFDEKARIQLVALGIDPDSVEIENRNGVIPA